MIGYVEVFCVFILEVIGGSNRLDLDIVSADGSVVVCIVCGYAILIWR